MRKVVPPFLRTAYNYDMREAGRESAITCPEPTLTKQADARDADINVIVDRFVKTGELPRNYRMPQYGDFLDILDFQGAMNAVVEAQQSFMYLPAKLRARFHNDPAEFVEFCSKPENQAEAVRLGIAMPPPAAPDTTAPLGVVVSSDTRKGGTTNKQEEQNDASTQASAGK